MQKKAQEFIELLESQQLLSPDIVQELQRQIAESKTRLSPELLAKLLVDNGHLTKFQATKLITEMKDSTPAQAEQEEDELGFAPSEEDNSEDLDAPEEEDMDIATVFIEQDVEVSKAEAVDVQPIAKDPSIKPVEVVEVVDVVEAVESVSAVEVVNTDPIDGGFDAVPQPAPRPIRPPAQKKNPWDSFRIQGVAVIVGLILIALVFLVYHFWRGDADDRLAKANKMYESRSYQEAADMYEDFAKSFTGNENVSFARVRSALATLRRDSEGAPNPSVGLKTALQVLPGITDEEGLEDQRSDLAGALIALATKFNKRADQAKTTADRKQLMGEMAQLLEQINNPQFVGANQRNQQAPTLLRMQEDRERIVREINRDEELATALTEIDEKLEAKDTISAYAIRTNLIQRYPLLEVNQSLVERVQQASLIQRALVTPGTLNPKLSQSPPRTTDAKSFVLGNLTGTGAPDLEGQVVFVKVKGSVFGLDAVSGEILWRKFVGREFNNEPIRLGETSATDALICQPEKGLVSRVDGRTGKTKWFVDFGTPIHMPVVENQDLYVSSFDGQVANLDLVGGQTKWTKKLPQQIEVPPGLARGKPHLYVPGEHSNLYVLSRRDGSCQEVHYLGHRAGSIAVPPTLLLGQLFVFENISSEKAKIRVLGTSDDGLELRNAQLPITVDGNVVVNSNVIGGRRLVVQSDLGQILVLDIEPTADSKKVTILASIPKSQFEPRLSWSVGGNNKLWVADTRFTRFDLQVTLEKLNRVWIKNDGDTFTGPPQLFDDVIIHTRALRGNRGVRVAAINAEDGQALWEIDLGVPISLIVNASKDKYDVVNSGGAYFALNSNRLRSTADANPGQGKASMLFVDPVSIDDSSVVMLNASKPNQLAYYSDAGTRLRILSANFGRAKPTCLPVAVGDKLAIGMDNGQFIMMDPNNGSLVASPYQPPMQPGKRVQWNKPAFLPDSQTLIVASSLQKLVRLGIGDALRPLTEVDLESPLIGPIAAVGNHVCAVNSTRSGDALTFYDATTLEAGETIPIDGRLVSGPFSVAGGCVLQTETQLTAFGSDAKQKWSVDFPNSELVAPPASQSDNLVFATRSGQIWIVNAESGEVIGDTDAGQRFTSAPVLLSGQLLIGSDEGAVLAVPFPKTRSEDR